MHRCYRKIKEYQYEEREYHISGNAGGRKKYGRSGLSKNRRISLLDSDLLIQQKTGKLLHELIEIHGREGFLEIEGEINASIDTKCTVIATGGSVVYEENAMQHLKEISTVVYIYLPYEELRTRLGSLEQRGVALKPEETLKDLYDSRSVLYKKYADITVDASHMGIQAVAEEILRKTREAAF